MDKYGRQQSLNAYGNQNEDGRDVPACCTTGPGYVSFYCAYEMGELVQSNIYNNCNGGAIPPINTGCGGTHNYNHFTHSQDCICPANCGQYFHPGGYWETGTPGSPKNWGMRNGGRVSGKRLRKTPIRSSSNRDPEPACCSEGNLGTWTCAQIGSGAAMTCQVQDNCTECGKVPNNYLQYCNIDNNCGGTPNPTFQCVPQPGVCEECECLNHLDCAELYGYETNWHCHVNNTSGNHIHTNNGGGNCQNHTHGGGVIPPPPAPVADDPTYDPTPKGWTRRGGLMNRKINRNRRRR